MTWTFVTGNANKVREARGIVADLESIAIALPEIQAATVREVALEKARAAFAQLARPVIVEDAGVELAALGGFPGPFIKYWEEQGGLVSICRALDGFADRRAVAVCVLGLCDAAGPRTVEGRVAGTIAAEPRGAHGFGWDTIFIPDAAGPPRTFAEHIDDEKRAISHRRLAWDAARIALTAGQSATG